MNDRNIVIGGLLCLFIMTESGLSQITATWPDPLPLNDPFLVEQDTSIDVSSLNLGVSAGNQTWVFMDTMNGEISQSDWLEVEGTPFDTAFAGADRVEHFWQYAPRLQFDVREDWTITVPAQLVEMFRYHRLEQGWIRTLGMGFQYDLMRGAPFVYDTLSFFYPETLTVNTDPWLEKYSFETDLLSFIASTVTDSTWIEADAWGELTIPAGTFETIRIKRHEFRNIHVHDIGIDKTVRLETYTYTWFAEDFRPLLSITAQAEHGDTIEAANLVSRLNGFPDDTTSGICDPSCRRISALQPEQFELSQNFPNPFNPETTIRFSVSVPARVRLDIFDVLGRRVDQMNTGFHTQGAFEIRWNGTDRNHESLPSGIYYYRITAEPVSGAPPFSRTRKMIMLR